MVSVTISPVKLFVTSFVTSYFSLISSFAAWSKALTTLVVLVISPPLFVSVVIVVGFELVPINSDFVVYVSPAIFVDTTVSVFLSVTTSPDSLIDFSVIEVVLLTLPASSFVSVVYSSIIDFTFYGVVVIFYLEVTPLSVFFVSVISI